MLSHQNMLQNVKAALDGLRGLHRRRVPLVPAAVAHARAHRGLLPHDDRGLARWRSRARSRSSPRTSRACGPTVIVSVPRIFERLQRAGAVRSSRRAAGMKRRLFELAHRVGWNLFEWRQGRGRWQPSFLPGRCSNALVADEAARALRRAAAACISGGAALNPQIAHTFIGLGLPICQGYGLTEASPVVCGEPARDATIRRASAWRCPGSRSRSASNDALLVRGPNVMLGYWNEPRGHREGADADGWLDTGDQARDRATASSTSPGASRRSSCSATARRCRPWTWSSRSSSIRCSSR